MPEALKKLGQQNPVANTDTNLYANATANGFSCSSVVICNTTASTVKVRVYSYAGVDGNMGVATALVYDKTLTPNDSMILQLGIVGANGDKLGCRSDTANVTFTAYGVEET